MAFLRTYWLPLVLGLMIVVIIFCPRTHRAETTLLSQATYDARTEEWKAPNIDLLSDNEEGRLIRYGKDLIVNTSLYLGPKGIVAPLTNGMNCQNCHINAGTLNYGNCFSAVAATYPKFRFRSGRVESIEYRINECMERSLNGQPLDSNSTEMKAMVAYLKWLGSDVSKGFRPKGAGTEMLPYLTRAADTVHGKTVYEKTCQRCHGANGEGVALAGRKGYQYPPLWGGYSYNVSAGMYTLSRLSGFIKNNMPFGTTYQNPVLTNEEAWDVAAYISSKPRPVKFFTYDWKDISKKPVDYPFGPYADDLTERQHKYGPFIVIKK